MQTKVILTPVYGDDKVSYLINMSSRKKDLIFSVLTKLIVPLSGLILIPIYLKFLTQEEYGYWLVVVGVSNYMLLANMGIAQTVSNYVAKNWWRARKHEVVAIFVSTAWTIYWFVILVIIVVITLAQTTHFLLAERSDLFPVFLMAVCTLLALPFQLFSVMLQSVERIYEEQACQIIAAVTKMIIFYLLLSSGFKLLGLIAANAVATVLPRILSWIRLKMIFPTSSVSLKKYDKRFKPYVLQNSIGFFVIQIASLLAFNTDNIVIGYFLGLAKVPEFALPAQIIMAIQTAIMTISVIYNPTITRLYGQNDLKKLQKLILSLIFILTQAGIFIFIIIFSLGDILLGSLSEKAIYPGQQIVFCLLTFMMIQLCVQPADSVLMATSNHKNLSTVVIIEGILNVTLSIWWVQIWGILGVILATLLARVGSVIYIYVKACDVMKLSHRILAGILLTSVAPLIFIAAYSYLNTKMLLVPNGFPDLFVQFAIFATVVFLFSRRRIGEAILQFSGDLK